MTPKTKKTKRTPQPKPAQTPNTLFNDTAKSVGFDYDRYAHFLDDSDLSDSQKQELLEALWNILRNFVELGFGVHPVQQAMAEREKDKLDCGQDTLDHSTLMAAMLYSEHGEIGGQT